MQNTRAPMPPGRLAKLSLIVVLLAALAGCSSNEPTATETETPSPSPTRDVPKVSEKTICDLLFDQGEEPMNDAVELVGKFANDPNASNIDQAKADEIAASLRSLAERAPATLEPHLTAEAEFLETLNEQASTGSVNFETFKSSGLEISNVCVPLL